MGDGNAAFRLASNLKTAWLGSTCQGYGVSAYRIRTYSISVTLMCIFKFISRETCNTKKLLQDHTQKRQRPSNTKRVGMKLNSHPHPAPYYCPPYRGNTGRKAQKWHELKKKTRANSGEIQENTFNAVPLALRPPTPEVVGSSLVCLSTPRRGDAEVILSD